ncbi:MAG: (d)CMP kinase [Dehalococcoidia bacterium]|nr:(d)CMP kinase [Dehalococcoidia bacterium]
MIIPKAITIDGPGAVGKNTVGSLLAKKLGYCFIDTGAMYRELTWKALKQEVDLADQERLSNLAAETEYRLLQVDGNERDCVLLINGREVGAETRLEEVERSVSIVAMVPGVRTELVAKQRKLAAEAHVVMIGRDIGTVVLPDSDLKIFLLASPEERARRRYLELVEKGNKVEFEQVLADLKRRDKLDSERQLSPLQPALDAVIVDTDGKSVAEVLDRIIEIIDKRK